MVWYGVVWCGMVWDGVGWCGMVWYGVGWYGMHSIVYGMVFRFFVRTALTIRKKLEPYRAYR
eukprot:scaffold15262_cov191-Amphora_coffeaeformis.AAC.1